MKKGLLLLMLLVFNLSHSQIFEPVTWSTSVTKITENEYELITNARIDRGWHLYSQDVPQGGPIATKFSYPNYNGNFDLIEGTKEEKGHIVNDPIFEMEIKYFEVAASFTQRVKVNEEVFSIQASVEYMVCDDERCLPPQVENLIFKIKDAPAASNTSQKAKETAEAEVEIKPVPNDTNGKKGLWAIFFIAFFSGFAALLTPCVFPMIPMTVSFFTKQSKSKAAGIKNAIIYGLCIMIIYVLLGTAVTAIFGADALNALATNVWFNIIFFLLLIIFAFSFLGAFEIMLPNTWMNKVDSKADKGGFIGIFFMALALAIVSFSCTGPIVGTLLVEAASKGGIAPIIGMLGFSFAIALPFALFAAFPGWLNSLPKSGGWLNSVKVFLGFLELALAFKFLSNADLVLQLHILERETFLAIWIAIFTGLALYLFGKITLPHDSPLPHISVGRLSLGLLTLAFVIYMIPGLWGAPLQWISGFPPPKQYSESPYGVGNSKGGASAAATDLPPGAELGPLDLLSFKDYDKGMAYAREQGKPVMLDFTGYACVNCRKMEERVWPDPQITQVLRDDLVLISLYVDDKKELPEREQYISKTTGKKIETIGNKWSDFQIEKYKANAQPYYVLIDNQGNNLNEPRAYDPDIDSYLEWLREGVENYK